MTTIVIVDDHPDFRNFMRSLLAADGFQVLADVADGGSAIELSRTAHPDVVLLDIQLPGIDGFEVADRLAELVDPPVVVMTSTRDAVDHGSRLTSAPVQAFIAKQELSAAAINATVAQARANG